MAGVSESGGAEELNGSFDGLEEEEEREGDIGESLTEGGRRRVFSKVLHFLKKPYRIKYGPVRHLLVMLFGNFSGF